MTCPTIVLLWCKEKWVTGTFRSPTGDPRARLYRLLAGIFLEACYCQFCVCHALTITIPNVLASIFEQAKASKSKSVHFW